MKTFDIKEKLAAFMLKEDGKISKKAILKAGMVLGAIALSAKAGKAAEVKGLYGGDCPGVDARVNEGFPYPGESGWVKHTNAAHENNLHVKNFFSRIVLGHSHCIETHTNYVHS